MVPTRVTSSCRSPVSWTAPLSAGKNRLSPLRQGQVSPPFVTLPSPSSTSSEVNYSSSTSSAAGASTRSTVK